jgi:hypothetical protein
MARGEQVATKAKSSTPDLDQQALQAAESAILEGGRALATARATLRRDPQQGKTKPRRRELVLRLLLAINITAMVSRARRLAAPCAVPAKEAGGGPEGVRAADEYNSGSGDRRPWAGRRNRINTRRHRTVGPPEGEGPCLGFPSALCSARGSRWRPSPF